MIRTAFALLFWLSALPASALDLAGQLTEGGLIRGHVAPGSMVTLDGKALRVAPDGSFVFGLSRDAPDYAVLTVTAPGGKSELHRLSIAARSWDIQRVDGLPEKTVTPDPVTSERIRQDVEKIKAARHADSDQRGFAETWVWPTVGRISGVYGSQRVLNGQPRSPHIGLDIAASQGTELHAPASGIVSLAAPDMVLTGNTIAIDHGFGVSSIFAHLESMAVKQGDRVTQGQVIGKVGITGRATGPHVHWGVFWYDVGVDPALLVPPMPVPAN